MGLVDYVKTPYMLCPQCGADPQWETKTRDERGQPACDDVTIGEVMQGRERMSMVGDCTRCNLFIEVYIKRIEVDGEVLPTPRELTASH